MITFFVAFKMIKTQAWYYSVSALKLAAYLYRKIIQKDSLSKLPRDQSGDNYTIYTL